MPNWSKKWFCAFDPLTKTNGHEFQTFYIRPRSAVDSAQWDWGMTVRLGHQKTMQIELEDCCKVDIRVNSPSSIYRTLWEV